MPTINFPGGGVQLDCGLVRSAVYTAFASVSDQTPVPDAQAGYFVGHFFSGNNGSGTDFGRYSIDIRTGTIFQYTGRANLVDVLTLMFPPPGPDQ